MAQPQIEEVFNMDGSDADRFFSSLRVGEVVYFAGQTSSTDFPLTNPLQPAFGGDDDDAEPGDMIVVKFNSSTDTIEWDTYLGGSGSDAATGLSLDGNGNLVVSGWTTSTDFPTLNPIQSALAGQSDGVIVKISPAGAIVFSTYLGGTEADQFSDTARDEANLANVFCGFTSSMDFPFPESNPDTAESVKPQAGNADYIVLSLSDDNTLKWVTLPDARRNFAANDVANALTVDAGGTILVTGYAESPNFVNNTLFGRHQGDKDMFLVSIEGSNGDRIDSVLVGGSGDDRGNDVTIGRNGVAVVVGQTSSTGISSWATQNAYGGGESDALIVTFAYTEFRMSRVAGYFGGSGDDFGRTVIMDPNGNVHLGGATSSDNLPFSQIFNNDPQQESFGGGGFDGFLLRINAGQSFGRPSMTPTSATYIGDSGEETVTSLHLSPYVDAPADNFGAYAIAFSGFGTPPEALAQQSAAGGRPVQTMESAPEKVRALYKAAREAGLAPDLSIALKPRPPLVYEAKEEVVLIITNKGKAPATSIDLYLDPDRLLSGELTGEILDVFLNGVAVRFDDDDEVFELPRGFVLAPDSSVEVTVLLRSLPGAILADVDGVGFKADVDPLGPDANPEDNERAFFLPVVTAPDIAVELVETAIDPEGTTPRKATFIYRIVNSGSAAAEDLNVQVSGLNLKNVTYSLAGQPAQSIADLDGPGVVAIPVGTLGPAQENLLTITGDLVRPFNQGASTTVRSNHPSDPNIENNSATGETAGKIYDYSVTVAASSVGYSFPVDGQSDLRHLLNLELKLSVPDGFNPADARPAVVVIEHNGEISSISTTPEAIGQCSGIGETTLQCTFSPSDFFRPDTGLEAGTINLRLTDNLGQRTIPDTLRITASVTGDGDNPTLPNNFAEDVQDMTRKGVLTLTRVSDQSRTVILDDGSVAVVVTQVLRVRNNGPGTVGDILLTISDRDRFAHLGGGIFMAARIIADGSSGASVTTNSAEETVSIASLPANAEVLVEVSDKLGLSATGNGEVIDGTGPGRMSLTTGGNNDLTAFSNTIFTDDQLNTFRDNSLVLDSGDSPDAAVTVESQRIETVIRDGKRVPFLVTELRVSNVGTKPVVDSEIDIRQSGVLPGGTITRPPNPLSQPYTQPGLPDDPLRRLVPVGNLDPGTSVLLVLRDEIAEPGMSQLKSISARVTHNSYDANISNNSTARDFEYLSIFETLDYGVSILIQTRENLILDGFLVPVVRTRLEFSISGDEGEENLPPFTLVFTHPGASEQVRLVPLDPSTPVPTTGFQCQTLPNGQTQCQFTAGIARNFLVEFVDRIVPPTGARVIQSRADITGDGEVPSGDNNNRAQGTIEYNPTPAADISVELVSDGTSSPALRFNGSVTDRFVVRNLSTTEIARNVVLNVENSFIAPLPDGVPSLLVVENAAGDIPAAASSCLTSGNPAGCSIGDIEPGGQRVVVITSALRSLPPDEDNYPSIAGVRLKAQASGELTLTNNQAVVFHSLEIPMFDVQVEKLEGDQFFFSVRILRPKALEAEGGIILESAPALTGPWNPVAGNSVDANGDSQFVRGRTAASGGD